MNYMDEDNPGFLDPISMETMFAYYEQERITLEKEEAEEEQRRKDKEFMEELGS